MSTYGNTAPSQNTVNYDSLLSTTLFNYRKTLADNIFKSSGFLTLLRQKGGVEYQSGGLAIAQPLMYETNSTVKSYSKYDTLDTTPLMDNLGACKIFSHCWNTLKPLGLLR